MLKIPGGQPWGPLEAEGRPFFFVFSFSRSRSSELGGDLQKNVIFCSRFGSSELGGDLQKNGLSTITTTTCITTGLDEECQRGAKRLQGAHANDDRHKRTDTHRNTGMPIYYAQ